MRNLAVSSFGAALATMYAAPHLQADIVPITFSQTTIAEGVLGTFVGMSTVGGFIGAFSAWNGGTNAITHNGNVASLGVVQYSQTLTAGFSPPVTNSVISYFTNVNTPGTHYIGFRSLSGNLGWFQVTILGEPGNMILGPGGYAPDGHNIHVGTVPAPGALALLALGAVGIRRKRKRAA